MKLLYIWIEEFRDIYNQGIIVDNEFLIKIRNPHYSSFGYYTDDGNRILSTSGVPKYGRKIFTREISWSKNEDYIQNKTGSAINSIAALVGKNATGKSSILTCLSSQEHEYLRIDDRCYLLVFLNQSEHCIEIRARGIQVVAENIVLRYSRQSDMYQVYIIPLEDYSPIYPGELDEQTLFYFLIPQKSVKSFMGYSVLGIPTIVGDLDAFDQQNAFDGAFEFLCQFPNLVSSGNKLVIYLNSTDRNQRNDYFEKPSLTCAEYKKFFIHRLAHILFSNLRSYLYHPTPEFTVDGTRIKLPNEERLMEEDRQCAQLLATFSGPYPNAGSSDLISFKTNHISRDKIKNLLNFFGNSTFSFDGKVAYNEYVKRITELFDTLFGADDKLFSAIFKLEIPFQNEYIPIVSAMQECINISNILNGNWANGVHVRFEWFSSGEFHIAMLFSAIYQRMKEVNKKDTNNRDIIWAIDEPEMHMHPELGRNFIDKLNRAMQQFKDRGL